MELNLTGKRVLITGGSKGIGEGIAKAFIEEGAKVGVVARGQEDLERVKNQLGVTIYQGDLLDEDERSQVFKNYIEAFGGIDILINNAGGSSGGKALETSLSEFSKAMTLNYLAAVHFSQLACEAMKTENGGSIINITSIFGRESGGKVTYNNAKAALISFTKGLADEVIRDGIRVNSVAPGSILHPTGNWQRRLEDNPEKIATYVEQNIPAGRFGTVEEIANVIVFLASERASWVVGATLNVDGGQSYMNS